MVTQRVVSSNYLGIGLAIATGLAANLGSSLQAQAQDLNLQTRIDTLLPPPVNVTPQGVDVKSKNFVTGRFEGDLKSTCHLSTDKAVRDKVNEYRSKRLASKGLARESSASPSASEAPSTYQQNLDDFVNATQNNKGELQKFGIQTYPIHYGCGGQPTTVKVSFPFNPTYETNILKSGNNSSLGESAGFGGNVLVTTAGLRPLDLVALSAGEASARYNPKFSPNVDTTTSYLAYQMFLHADGYAVVNNQEMFLRNIDQNTTAPVPPAGMITVDTVTFAIQNQTAFTPTFHAEKADFFTPQVTLSSQNINLDGPNPKPCANTLGQQSFCNYANLSLTVGQSFSDVVTQQNVNAAASATIGWKPDKTDFNFYLQTTATGKHYENFVGGRDDLLLQAGVVLTYSPSCPPNLDPKLCPVASDPTPSLTFSLPVTYNKNYSTVSAAAWSGWVIMPTLTIAFSHTAAAVMPPN